MLKKLNDWTNRKPALARNITVFICCFGAAWSIAFAAVIGQFGAGFATGILLMGAGCAIASHYEKGKL